MRTFGLPLLFLIITVSSATGAELLWGDEQSFETGITPGRWQQFTWPCVWETCPGPGGSTCVTGVRHPTLIGSCSQGPDGNPVDYLHYDDSPSGWGTKCLGIYDFDGPGWDAWGSTGGVMITLPVVADETYTISGYIKFATGGPSETGWRSGGGISVDTDGGTDAGDVEYGYGYDNAIQSGDILIGTDNPSDTGDAIWNREGTGGDNAEIWWGPSNFTFDTVPTAGQMTIFLWGFNRFRSNVVLFDGISVDGPLPPPPAGLPEAEWSLYE